MNRGQKLAIARLALRVCADDGYQLQGSLALDVHGVADARDPEDIDLITHKVVNVEAARERVSTALREHGFDVKVLKASAPPSFVDRPRCADLTVTDARENSVVLQMARTPRHFESHDVEGMPVAAPGELLYSKLEALKTRIAAKDYLDLVALGKHLGQPAVDSLVSDYVTGAARMLRVPQEEFGEEVYMRLAQAADVPNKAFAGYGVEEEAAAHVRAVVLAWADRIAPSTTQRLEPRLAAGLDAPTREGAAAALGRLTAAGPLALLTAAQLSTGRAEAVRESHRAQWALDRMTEAVLAGLPPPKRFEDALRQARAKVQEVAGIGAETSRRAPAQ